MLTIRMDFERQKERNYTSAGVTKLQSNKIWVVRMNLRKIGLSIGNGRISGGKMATWFIKEFSVMTNISVRSLHHYDRIGLLKPSKRLSNGYRVYSQFDLLKVQPLIALRFLGFSLAAINDIFKKETIKVQHLQAQRFTTHEQLEEMRAASKALDLILEHLGTQESMELSVMLKLIEEHVFAELRKKIVGAAAVVERPSAQELVRCRELWEEFIAEVEKSLAEDPRGTVGKAIAHRWVELIKEFGGTKSEMKEALAHAYRSGKIPTTHFSTKLTNWLEVALHQHINKEVQSLKD